MQGAKEKFRKKNRTKKKKKREKALLEIKNVQ
jgi:hypothetical protein